MPFGPKMTAFLAAIRVMPDVTRAAKAAKIHKSQHYDELKFSPEILRRLPAGAARTPTTTNWSP